MANHGNMNQVIVVHTWDEFYALWTTCSKHAEQLADVEMM